MSGRLISFASLAALVAGVAALANGVASLLATPADNPAAWGLGVLLVAFGLSSWIAGVILSKRRK